MITTLGLPTPLGVGTSHTSTFPLSHHLCIPVALKFIRTLKMKRDVGLADQQKAEGMIA